MENGLVASSHQARVIRDTKPRTDGVLDIQ